MSRVRPVLWVSCLALLSFLFLTNLTLAASPPPDDGVLQCNQCHSAETQAWQGSSHASSGIDCTVCHGPYVDEHPGSAMMEIGIESTICKDCHTDTYDQWMNSLHAKKGVQCIGCHLSHSQEFRLTDEALCGSCHRDVLTDYTHTAHSSASLKCIDCHVSSPGASSDASSEGQTIPSHRFIVESTVCVGCHGESIHQAVATPSSKAQTVLRELQDAESTTLQLGERIQNLEKDNRRLQTMTLASLGFGIGIGGIVGIVFVLVIGYVAQGRTRR